MTLYVSWAELDSTEIPRQSSMNIRVGWLGGDALLLLSKGRPRGLDRRARSCRSRACKSLLHADLTRLVRRLRARHTRRQRADERGWVPEEQRTELLGSQRLVGGRHTNSCS